jgi:hypothetical protein
MGIAMKKHTLMVPSLILFLIVSSFNINAQSRTKLAQTGMKFLAVSTDARSAGMSDAITSVHGSSSAMLYNPAGMANLDRFADISFGQTSWIADINYISATAAFLPFGSDFGVFGISLMAVDYGDFQGTVRASNESGYLDTEIYSPTAMAVGVGYAKSLSEKFAIGGNVKWVKQSLIDKGVVGIGDDGSYIEEKFEESVLAFDFGLIYKTGFKSLNLGMSVRNFSEEIKYIEEGFQLPLTFKIGASFDLMDMIEADKSTHSFLLSVDAINPRDFEEQLAVGGEYTFLEIFSLRAGYQFPTDESGLSAGVGIKKDLVGVLLGVDYSYTDFGLFDNVHRFSVRLGY